MNNLLSPKIITPIKNKDLNFIEKLEIPFKTESYTFSKKYIPNKIISEEIFTKEMNQINKKVAISLHEKRKNDLQSFPKILTYGAIICFVLFIIFFITLSKALSDVEDKKGFMAASIIISIIIITGTFLLSIYNWNIPTKKFYNLSHYLNIHLGEYIEELNREYKNIKFEIEDINNNSNRKIIISLK